MEIRRGITSPEITPEEREFDISLRPRTLSEFIGQNKNKEQLQIFIEAARNRGEVLDHVLLSGPPGLGKTTLANIIAQEMSVTIHATSGPAIERQGDLAAILTNLEPGDVLFIDEIHRLPRTVEEILYPAMEDFKIDIMIGKGPSARSLRLELQPYTLIGATTRVGLISAPLLTRFGVSMRLDYYPLDEMEEIVRRASRILSVEMDSSGCSEIAKRSRGTPRVANRLLRRVRDYAEVKANSIVTGEVALEAMKLFEVDDAGLDVIDRAILETIIDKFQGGPVGLKTLAAAIGEDPETIEDVYEPYLMQLGFVKRTPRGRVATANGFRHLGRDLGRVQNDGDSLFRL